MGTEKRSATQQSERNGNIQDSGCCFFQSVECFSVDSLHHSHYEKPPAFFSSTFTPLSLLFFPKTTCPGLTYPTSPHRNHKKNRSSFIIHFPILIFSQTTKHAVNYAILFLFLPLYYWKQQHAEPYVVRKMLPLREFIEKTPAEYI